MYHHVAGITEPSRRLRIVALCGSRTANSNSPSLDASSPLGSTAIVKFVRPTLYHVTTISVEITPVPRPDSIRLVPVNTQHDPSSTCASMLFPLSTRNDNGDTMPFLDESPGRAIAEDVEAHEGPEALTVLE